jgi:hypothetical protein
MTSFYTLIIIPPIFFLSLFTARQLILDMFKIHTIFYSYVHTMLASFLPLSPTPSLTTHPALSLSPITPSISSRHYFALISNFLEERV